MNIILAAILFAMVFYGASTIIRMVKAIRASGFLSPLGGGYGIGWFATLILLNIVILSGIILYYRYKRRTNIGTPGYKGFEGHQGNSA